jgi:hypothetical protein
MIGIAFNLILIRVHRGRAAALNPRSAPTRPPASTLRFGDMPGTETSHPSDTAMGDLESNYNLDEPSASEGSSDSSNSFAGLEKAPEC